MINGISECIDTITRIPSFCALYVQDELPLLNHISNRQTNAAYCNNYRRRSLVYVLGALCPILLPLVHIFITKELFGQYSREVDPHSCLCSCWDRVFKGTYEAGVSTYKHVYFNATSNTFAIWTITVLSVLLAYECSRYLCRLYLDGQLRLRMLLLWASVLYPHYYSWWVYLNYLNDDFYSQIYHQLYFTVTELLSTYAVLYLADGRRSISPRCLLVVLSVAVAHIVVSSFDQLVANVVRGEGSLNQVTRDIGLFLPDVLHAIVVIADFVRLSKNRRLPIIYLVTNRDFAICVSFVLLSWLFCFYL